MMPLWQQYRVKTSMLNAPPYLPDSPKQATNLKETGETLYPSFTTTFAEYSAKKIANASLNPDLGTMLLSSSLPHQILLIAKYIPYLVHINLPKTSF
jgi:hypothetical protein